MFNNTHKIWCMKRRAEIRRTIVLFFVTLLTAAQAAETPQLQFNELPTRETRISWPILESQPAPDGLRPCCALGFDLEVQVLGIPVPFYHLDNIIDADTLGHHHYNNGTFSVAINLLSLNDERNGLLYTHRGGIIDMAHVRDTADNTLYLFSQILPRLGRSWQLDLGPELALRRISFSAFTRPKDAAQRYTLAAYLAGNLAFKLAVWHEIAQWYGYQSVPGFSEAVSAFSPEDLYSNLLGARLSTELILQGQAASLASFNRAMSDQLPIALAQFGPESAEKTRQQLSGLDGDWWDSSRRLPDKFLVLKRNYDTSDSRLPSPVPFERSAPLRLLLPARVLGFKLTSLAELQLWPGNAQHNLSVPARYYTPDDFLMLAQHAHTEDTRQEQILGKSNKVEVEH